MEFKVYEQLWWATPIWECPVIGIDNEEIKNYCLETRERFPGVTISNRGGWHSGQILLPIAPSLQDLFNDITVFANDVCARHTGFTDLMMGNFWININGHHDYNTVHDHQKSILSGVYYVSVPEDNMGDIVFHRNDNAEYYLTSEYKFEQTMSNALNCTKPPKESTFYLFPSWVKHSVERNESYKERISIAFNIVPQLK